MKRRTRHSNILPMEQPGRSRDFGVRETVLLFGGAVVLGGGIGAAVHFWPTPPSAMRGDVTAIASTRFGLCTGRSDTNCVVDGDTIRFNGDKIRLVGFDTPEISDPACAAEATKGETAKRRLLELLNSGEVSFSATADRDRDRYGRLLRQANIDGSDVADVMISEGLAEPYEGGQKRNWC